MVKIFDVGKMCDVGTGCGEVAGIGPVDAVVSALDTDVDIIVGVGEQGRECDGVVNGIEGCATEMREATGPILDDVVVEVVGV